MGRTKQIKTKNDFISFVYELRKNYKENSESWENDDIGTFLGALAAWVEDMDGFYLNQNQSIHQKLDWKIIADMLSAAKSYE
jgi:hypothetical protein